MTTDFNPYRDWLELDNADSRPDHYRLLGLERFESDPEQIKALTREVESLRSDLYEFRSHLSALLTLSWVFLFMLGLQYLLTPHDVNREDIDKNPLNLNDYRQD